MQTASERIKIAVGSTDMGAYVAKPEGDGAWPGVLLFMEIFGVNAHIRSVADRVASEGYVVVTPDLFHRTAPGIELGYDEAGLQKGIALMSAVKGDELLADVKSAYEVLGARGDVSGKGVGAMGFCFGGHVAYRAACELPIKATASFYGGGIASPPAGGQGPATIDRTPGISGKIVCFFGEKDGYIPLEDVAKIRKALEAAGTAHDVNVYPGVGHGFFCDVRDDYDAKSASDAWSRLTALFSSELT